MVRGFEIFREYFRDFTDRFMLIGGTACELNLSDFGGFRSTKDIDILILLENMNASFASAFHNFLLAGKYKCYVSKDGKRHFYRFLDPDGKNFPQQIELLSRSLIPEHKDLKFTPLSKDQYIRSMSAIILSEDYYNFGISHRTVKQEIPCLDSKALLVFKTAAYLNLRQQKSLDASSVRSDDILKHRNDVFRLLGTLVIDSPASVPDSIRSNLKKFIEFFPETNPEWRSIIQSIGTVADTPEHYIVNFMKFAGLSQ